MPVFVQYSPNLLTTGLYLVTYIEGGLFDLVLLFVNRSRLLIDSVYKTMLSIFNSDYPLDMSRFLNCKINCAFCGLEGFLLYRMISPLINLLNVAFGCAPLR